MKMKKVCLLFSMLTVLFSLCACSNGQEELNFSYTDTDIIYSSVMLAYNLQNMDDSNRAYINAEGEEVYQTALSNFDKATEECGTFKGYYSKEDGSSIMVDLASLDTTKEEDVATLTQFINLVDAKVEEEGANVTVTLKANYEKRVVDLTFVYEGDSKYAYGASTTPYKPTEITALPEYTLGEKMESAAANTLMGMGTVFVILIFISLIISQFERISKIGTKKQTKENTAASAPVAAPAATVTSNLMDDSQLVAVITAAIMAENVSSGNSNDKLIVRSIKRAKR